MSLTGRFSLFFLSALGLVLLGFSLTLYVSARVYLGRQLSERLAASLAVLAAAAEVHPEGVEWEPQERVLPLGQESGPERLRWMVFDPSGRRIDHSHNLVDAELTAAWNPGPGKTGLPGRLADGKGRLWKLSQRAISSGSARPFRSTAETRFNPYKRFAFRRSVLSISGAHRLRASRPDAVNARRARLVPRDAERVDLASICIALPVAITPGA